MGGCESREKEVDSVPQAAVCQNLGEYAVTYSQLPVNASKDRNSAQVAVLEVQTKIEVLEFASEAVESRVRARIASPPGWITAWMVDKTSVYIKQESSGVALKAVQEGNDSIIASARPLAGALSVKAREGARLGPQELQVLGEYDEEAGPQGKAQKRCYKKRDGDIYLYWCDGRSGAKYSDAWWFSRCTDAKHCLFFSPSRSDEDMNSATPPERGWQAPPPYFFQAAKVTPIKVVLKGPPPPSVMDVAVRIKSCGGGCLDFISDVRDALRQRNKAAAEKKAAAAKKAADDEAAAKKKAAEEAAKKAPEQAAAEKKAAAEDKAAAEKKAAAESAAAKKAAHDEEAAKEKGAEEAAKKAPEQAAAEKKAAAEEKDGIAPTAEESPPEKRMNDDEATA